MFVGGRCHEEEKRGMIYFETTHKRLSIHVFLSKIHKNSMKNNSKWYHVLVDVHFENYNNYHQTKNDYFSLVADVTKKEKEEWYILKLQTKGFLLICF